MSGEREPRPIAPYPLPRVTVETAEALRGDALEQGSVFIERLEETVWDENPILLQTVGEYVTLWGIKDPKMQRVIKELILLSHELLRKQGEANRLLKDLH